MKKHFPKHTVVMYKNGVKPLYLEILLQNLYHVTPFSLTVNDK